MYLAAIVLLMGVLPAGSIIVELALSHGGADLLALVGKWFVFWACGIRLLLAGLKQVADPGFTAKAIFGIEDKAAEVIVRELGFGNLSIGLLGSLTLWQPAWIVPAAIAAGLFYGLAGLQHLLKDGRNAKENIAMVSDLLLFALLAIFLAGVSLRTG